MLRITSGTVVLLGSDSDSAAAVAGAAAARESNAASQALSHRLVNYPPLVILARLLQS